MQLFSRNKALAALSLGALAALGACGDDVTVPAPVNPPVVVTVSPSNANVNVGSFVDLAVSITGGATTPTLTACATSNAAVATAAVQGGNACRVTGVSTGAVSITATTSAGQTAGASVTVNAPAPAISGIAISPAASNLAVNGTVTITANPTTQAPGASVARAFVSSNAQVATVSAAGVVTAVAPGQATITVTLTGTGTGLTAASVTGQVAITVTANPPAVTGVTASPSSATLVTGGTQQLTATATYATGNTGTITYGTSNPGVATVSGTGLVTAVGPGQAVITVTASSAGNASFAAASATAQVPVTVNAPAQVSIANITTAETNNPVNINDVQGQIQVQLNLLTNNNVVRSVRLFVCPVGGSCPMAPAAEQTFGTAGAASGSINMFINTADFTVAADWSDATVRYTNGQKNIVAQISTEAASQANNSLAILNFNNADNFAARHVAPTRSLVNTSTNLTWFGGPNAEGQGTTTIVPVIYTAGRTIARATSSAACASYTFVTGTDARPWTITYGGQGTTAAGTTFNCNGSTYTSLAPAVSGVIDNAQNSVTLPMTFATTSSSTPAVALPATIRADYAGPTVTYTLTAPANGELGWVNGTYNFATATMTEATGIGAAANTTITYAFQGCGVTTWTSFTTNTGADIGQCQTDFTGGLIAGTTTRGPYTARATGADRLGNSSNSSAIGPFGVDTQAPLLEWVASGTLADSAVVTTYGALAGGTSLYAARTLDERSGLATSAIDHNLSFANQANAGSICVVTASASAGSNFIDAPNCAFGAWTISATVDAQGYRLVDPITNTILSSLQGPNGYYSYAIRATDRAGNRSTVLRRRALVYNAATEIPTITGMGLPSVVTAAANTFTPNFTETVESWFNSFRVIYGDSTINTQADTLIFPATQTYARFDATIGSNGNTTTGTPFTSGNQFYTNLERVAADSSFTGSTSARPDSVGFVTTNVGNLASNPFYVALLSPNVNSDNVAWATKAPLVTRFYVAPTAEAFNAPNNGLKAQVVASTNLINSPFDRIDFYQLLAGGRYEFIGSVAANATPCTLATQAGCGVYIADNGGQRVWTYVLRQRTNSSTSLTAGTAITTQPTGTFIAVATRNNAGRAVSTLPRTFP